jgi:signal transduction histidine kinase/CheY-like chemotaxis protein/integral membrane sensor domain MASE1
MRLDGNDPPAQVTTRLSPAWNYALAGVGLAAAYALLAKLSLHVSAIPDATAFWPCTGLVFAAAALWGPRFWPAILAGGLIAYAVGDAPLGAVMALALGNAFQLAAAGLLFERFSIGPDAFDTPTRVGKFALVAALLAIVAASVAVAALSLLGYADATDFSSAWLRWWIGDLTGALLVAPVVVLLVRGGMARVARVAPPRMLEFAATLVAAAAIGLLVLTPLVDVPQRAALTFLVVLPLLWAALRGDQLTSAVTALVVASCAVSGSLFEASPFGPSAQTFWPLAMLLLAVPLLSLFLSAHVAVGRSEKRRLRARLVQRDAQLLRAERLANFGTFTWTIPAGRIALSERLLQIHGLPAEDAESTVDEWIARVHDDDRARVREQLGEAVAACQSFEISYRIVQPNGNVGCLQSSGEVIADPRGKPICVLGCCQDITEFKAAEEAVSKTEQAYHRLVERVRDFAKRNASERREAQTALEQAREQLAQSQKMEAVGQLTGGVAHDFNNLLTIVVGNLEIAQRTLDNWTDGARDRVRRLVTNAMRGAQKGTALTQRLLAFSRRQPLDPKVLDLNKSLAGMSEFMRRSLGETIKLEMIGADGLWRIEADPVQLESAILNLAVNARDAMPKGGKLTIETSNVFLDEAYCRKTGDLVSGEYVEIAVGDTGEGMSEKVVQHAFEPFFTTKVVGQGTGLGLSQVYGFVKQSGGHVEIASELGRGTMVTIYLPRLHGDFRDQQAEESQVSADETADTILVVEDDHDVRAYVGEILRELNYRVFEAHDSEAALTLLDRKDVQVDLLLSDVVLPGMNGRQLADELKRRQPAVKVLFMTGYARDAIVHDGRLDPGVQLIQKPFTKDDLAARVKGILSEQTPAASELRRPAPLQIVHTNPH